MNFHKQLEPKKISTHICQHLQVIPFATIVGVPLFFYNFCQIFVLALRPLSPKYSRLLNHYIAHSWLSSLVWWIHNIHRNKIIFFGDVLPDAKNAILIANHQEMPDIPALIALAHAKKSTGGLKFFLKNSLKFVPGLGWGIRMLDFIFVKRNWTKDIPFIDRMFRRLENYETPVWIVNFPEGTRLKNNKLELSKSYAAKHGMPVLQNVLNPRSKGFVTAVQRMRRKLDGVYDITIAYPNGIPTLWQFIRGQVKETHLFIKKIPIVEIPVEDTAIEQWLQNQFVFKDKLLEYFLVHKKFPDSVTEITKSKF